MVCAIGNPSQYMCGDWNCHHSCSSSVGSMKDKGSGTGVIDGMVAAHMLDGEC
jgi:hypothetical protein